MILITCNLRDKVENVERLLDSINLDDVVVFILDLRKEKEDPSLKREKIRVEYLKIAIEDSNKVFDITYTLALQNNISIYCNVDESVYFNKPLGLMLDEDFTKNENIAICFSDCLLSVEDTHNSLVPIVVRNFFEGRCFFVRTYPQNLIQEASKNGLGYLDFLSKAFVVKHFPELMYCVNG